MSARSAAELERALVAMTLRLNERYLVEVVEAFGLCPWAKGARLSGQLSRAVLLQRDTSLDPALAQLDAWSQEPRLEIGLLIFPLVGLGFSEFQRFTNLLIDADAQRRGRTSSPFAMAPFHPDAARDLATADRLVPYLRRSPDPTIQVVRVSALERVRGQEVSGSQFVDLRTFRLEDLPAPQRTLRERIASHNHATVKEQSAALESALSSIHEEHALLRKRLEGTLPEDAS